jgi:hypothetical protein
VIEVVLASSARVGDEDIFEPIVVIVSHRYSRSQSGVSLHYLREGIIEASRMMTCIDACLMGYVVKPSLVLRFCRALADAAGGHRKNEKDQHPQNPLI